MKKKISIGLVAVVVALAGYYSYVVIDAREKTATLIQTAKLKIPEPVSKEDFSDAQLKELIDIQDPRFFSHHGTDFTGKRVTTITQGLVKILYFEKFKPGLAKIKQSLIARYALDPLVSKNEQLNLFLNLAYFGEYGGKEIRGFGEAAKVYFGKSPRELSQNEYLRLLAMLSGPNLYHLKRNPEKNAEQVALLRKSLGLD